MDADKLNKGGEHIKTGGGGGKRYTPVIYWKEHEETRFLAFLTSIEEMITLDVHMVQTKNGWRTFVCRKNPAFHDESGNTCILCDLFDNQPSPRTFALAAELEPVETRVGGRRKITDLQVKMNEVERDGETKLYPRIGIVIQAAKNFYNYVKTYDATRAPITEVSFEIIRQGKKSDTSYQFFDYPLRPELDEYEEFVPDMLAYIQDMGSEERYAEELAGMSPSESEAPAENGGGAEDTSFEALRARLEKSK